MSEEKHHDRHEQHIRRIHCELVASEQSVEELIQTLHEGFDLSHESLLRSLGNGGDPFKASLEDGKTQS